LDFRVKILEEGYGIAIMVSDCFAASVNMAVVEFDAPANLMSVVDATNSFFVTDREA
jgi:hypothetical protein